MAHNDPHTFVDGSVAAESLSGQAHLALCYSIAELKKHPWWIKKYAETMAKTRAEFPSLTDNQIKRDIATGMQELVKLGVVEVEKDGMGGWKPTKVHPGRISWPKQHEGLITEDIQ